MSVVTRAPAELNGCALFAHFQQESQGDGLVEKANTLVRTISPLLDMVIAGPFRNYTLHNPAHARKLVHLTAHILAPATVKTLSSLECALIIYSAYLHDLGMALTSVERERLMATADFQDALRWSPGLWQRLSTARTVLSGHCPELERAKREMEVFQLQEVALSEYLRKQHASRARYQQLCSDLKTQTHRPDLFEVDGVSFEEILIDICESHNLDVGVLAEISGAYEARFPRDLLLGNQRVNVQFCAAILRLTDILDFDRERTPRVLFENLGIEENDLPGGSVSLMEWQKHMAVHDIEITEHEITFSGESRHPAIEASVNDFAQTIEREIRATLSVIRNNPTEIAGKYTILLPTTVRTRIRSIGYTFHDIRMRLNQSSVINLLMGERLYSHPGAALRELVQNAVDACAARFQVLQDSVDPQIHLSTMTDSNRRRWIEVADNGIGMDEFVISNYLFNIGSSYYDSPEFDRLVRRSDVGTFNPISRFGIGFAAVFMICDLVEVRTCNPKSIRSDVKERTVRIDGLSGIAFITERASGSHGTSVRLRLKPTFASDERITKLEAYLRDVLVRPRYPVTVELARKLEMTPRLFASMRRDLDEITRKHNAELVCIELEKFSQNLTGIVVLPFVRTPDGLSQGGFQGMVFDRLRGIDPADVLEGFAGNRLTVNGFRMAMRKANRAFGKRVRFAYDIDVLGDKEIVYDVARERISGNGSAKVRASLRDAIVLGLKETGVFERLDEFTKNYITTGRLFQGESTRALEEDFVLRVMKEIPSSPWPVGMHVTIAEKLGVSGSLIRKAVTFLLETGRIEDGRRTPEQRVQQDSPGLESVR